MGVDTKIILPPYVRCDTVADVLGKLVGLKHVISAIPSCDVQGIEIRASGVTSCAWINWTGGTVPGYEHGGALYHFEGSRLGERLMMPRSYPTWIAIGARLVEFFGGRVDFNDCDDEDTDIVGSVTYPDGLPEDGQPWRDLQNRIAAVRPITPEEVARYVKHAAYSE
jgi:hypothetical protein